MDLQREFDERVDGVEPLLLLPVQDVLLLESERVPLDALAVAQPVALPDVFKSVQLVVSETQMIHPKVD